MFYILKTFAYDAWKNFYRLLNSNSLAKTHTKLFLKNELTPPKTLQSSFKLKKSSKNATTLIFFPVKAEMLLFSNFTSGGHQGGHPFPNFGFERHHNFQKKAKFSKFQIKIDCPVSALVSARCKIWKEQHLSFHWKKINVVKFFYDFLSLKTWTLCKSVIFKRFICQHVL